MSRLVPEIDAALAGAATTAELEDLLSAARELILRQAETIGGLVADLAAADRALNRAREHIARLDGAAHRDVKPDYAALEQAWADVRAEIDRSCPLGAMIRVERATFGLLGVEVTLDEMYAINRMNHVPSALALAQHGDFATVVAVLRRIVRHRSAPLDANAAELLDLVEASTTAAQRGEEEP